MQVGLRQRRIRIGLAAAVAALLAGSAQAEESSTDEGLPSAAFLGGDDDAPGRIAEAMALLNPPVSLADVPRPLGALLPPGRLTALGVARSTACAGEPRTALDYQGLADELYRRSLALEETAPVEAEIQAALACLSEPLPPSVLARPVFLEAMIRYGEGRLEEADAAFRELFTMHGSYPWDDDYPPEAQVRFAGAMTEVAGGPTASLAFVAVDAASLWVDGVPHDPAGDAVELPAGRHVVQLTSRGGQGARAVVVEITAGERGLIVDPAALDAADDAYLARLDRVVGALHDDEARGAGQAPDYLVDLTGAPALLAWDGARLAAVKLPQRAAAVLSTTGVADDTATARRPVAGPVLIGAGLAAVVAGGVLTGVSNGRMNGIDAAVAAGEMPYAHPDDPDPTDQMVSNRQSFLRARGGAGIGTGLMVAGGVAAAIGIPLTIRGRRTATVAAAPLWTPSGADGAPALGGVAFSLTIR
jgi:hypothetical protein